MSCSLPRNLRDMSDEWLAYERIAQLNMRDALWTERGSNANALACSNEAVRIEREQARRRALERADPPRAGWAGPAPRFM